MYKTLEELEQAVYKVSWTGNWWYVYGTVYRFPSYWGWILALGGGIREIPKEITWCTPSLLHLDPPTNQRELEVQKIVHLQTSYQMCSQIRFDIPTENVPSRVDVPKEQSDGNKINEPRVQLKRGRPAGSKDKNPWKKKKLDEQSKVLEEPDIERCLKEDINGKVPEEPVIEKCLKGGINKDDPDDEKGT